MYELIGIAMFIVWGYSIYIVVKRTHGITTIEKIALGASLVTLLLFIIGSTIEDEPIAPDVPSIPTKYECLQLGSDSARAACLNYYYN